MNDKRCTCEKIRALRNSMKLTQSQFAELVDLSVNALGKIERGINLPNIDTLYKIAEKTKIPIEALFSSKKGDAPKELPKGLLDFITYLKTRSPEEIKLLHSVAAKILGKEKVKRTKKKGKSTPKAFLLIAGDSLKMFPMNSK